MEVGVLYSCTEAQSGYSTAPVDRVRLGLGLMVNDQISAAKNITFMQEFHHGLVTVGWENQYGRF